MKKRQEIALMLISMIAFMRVGAAEDYCPPATTSEPALRNTQTEPSHTEVNNPFYAGKTYIVTAQPAYEPYFCEKPQTHVTSTRVKGVNAPAAEATSTLQVPFDPGSC